MAAAAILGKANAVHAIPMCDFDQHARARVRHTLALVCLLSTPAESLLPIEPLLSPAKCAALTRWAAHSMPAPPSRVHVHASELRELIGHAAFFRLRHSCDERLGQDAEAARRDFTACVCSQSRDGVVLDVDERAVLVAVVPLKDGCGRLLVEGTHGPQKCELRAGDALFCEGPSRLGLEAAGDGRVRHVLLCHFFGALPDGAPSASRHRLSRAARLWSRLRTFRMT